jgi:ribulose 1,5-bisphosphate synthetase/thiazole synthase
MNGRISRRELVRIMAAAGFGSAFARRAVADQAEGGVPAAAVPERKLIPNEGRLRYPAVLEGGRVLQPAQPVPVMHETEVLVVGGGAAGFAAAVAAARAGAKTALVERYGYLGGLWTGGLVLLVDATHAREGGQAVKVLRGIGDELLERHTKIDGAIVNQGPRSPTTDPEATKFLMDEMIREAGVRMFFHCWAADAVMDGPAIRGVVFESKAGRQAILAKVVVDASGDGDVFAAAGAAHEQRLHAIGLVHRLGNVDRADMEKLKAAGFKSLGSVEPLSSVKWVNLRGPSANALDVGELSRLEVEHRRAIWNRVQKLRQTPGAENVFLLQTAPQLGVRTTRLLAGVQRLTFEDAKAGRQFDDTVGVGGVPNASRVGWRVPYGALVPKSLDGLLAAGRCICVDEKLIEDMRLIAPCLMTGHAAGAAAAVAVKTGRLPRAVDVREVQKVLAGQGAFLGA